LAARRLNQTIRDKAKKNTCSGVRALMVTTYEVACVIAPPI